MTQLTMSKHWRK